MSKNDERVLQLKKIIDEKKAELKAGKKFIPITNCVLELDNQKYNLNVLQINDLKLLLVKLNMYRMSADDLRISFEISGYDVKDWITDIENKIVMFTCKAKEMELKNLETKLDKMLSDEKKTELELDSIAALLQ